MAYESLSTPRAVNSVKQNRWLFLVILTLMSTAGLVGSDLYLPVLPKLSHLFNKDKHAMQLTLSVYLVGLSVGQLLLGPLSDRFGRKKLIVLGMFFYLLASLSCAWSTTYLQLLISRFLQAIGACSGLVMGRAIVGDVFDAKEAGKVFSTIFPVVGMSPAISPVIGGYLGYYLGWQATFLFVSLFALLTGLLAWLFLPETLLVERRQALHLLKVLADYPRLFVNKIFIAYASAPCVAYIVFFAYIADSPFIFSAHGFGERAIGTFYISLSITYVIGNLTGKRLLKSQSLDKVLGIGYWIFLLGGLLLLVVGVMQLPLFAMIVAISISTFGNGFLIPLGTAGVVSSFSKNTGYASGLLGFLQLGCAALSSSVIGIFSTNSIMDLSIYIFCASCLGMILFSAFKKKGEV